MSPNSPLSKSIAAEAALGALHILPLMLGAAPFGLLLGSLAARAGLSPLEVVLMSAVIFAGSSQFIAVELWGAGAGGAAIVGSVLLVNLRHLLLGASLAPMVRGHPLRRLAPALFLMCDEVWAMGMRRGASLTLAYWCGLGLTLYTGWVVSTVVGAVAGSVVADPAAWGLDFAFTAVFVCLLAGFWRGPASALPWVAGAAVAALVHHTVPVGAWHILAGGLAGAAVGALRVGRRR